MSMILPILVLIILVIVSGICRFRTEVHRVIRDLNEKHVYPIVPLNDILEVVKTCQDIKLMTTLIVDDYLAKQVYVNDLGYAVLNAPPLMKLGEVYFWREKNGL